MWFCVAAVRYIGVCSVDIVVFDFLQLVWLLVWVWYCQLLVLFVVVFGWLLCLWGCFDLRCVGAVRRSVSGCCWVLVCWLIVLLMCLRYFR